MTLKEAFASLLPLFPYSFHIEMSAWCHQEEDEPRRMVVGWTFWDSVTQTDIRCEGLEGLVQQVEAWRGSVAYVEAVRSIKNSRARNLLDALLPVGADILERADHELGAAKEGRADAHP